MAWVNIPSVVSKTKRTNIQCTCTDLSTGTPLMYRWAASYARVLHKLSRSLRCKMVVSARVAAARALNDKVDPRGSKHGVVIPRACRGGHVAIISQTYWGLNINDKVRKRASFSSGTLIFQSMWYRPLPPPSALRPRAEGHLWRCPYYASTEIVTWLRFLKGPGMSAECN